MSQLRGNQESGAEKYRITVELAQVVRNYFDAELDPVGELAQTLVIVPGTHARLSNISDEGTFLKDEVF